ncbi:hypothetical protein K450DRAFT_227770 [Umbelopsis ramanniana AG]|uniref:beta-glucosidase n=1 Tax=Umbelopsis ramanniana AG TaxID=1314678 RepID=A0AAD5EGN9_UMBRA|nr:uncharacterized protein K450DRAFT_227770 [Umbelopsis ramanniana AG]KAI8582566.1 hypothetical protein K450DRAFT_227770 [Umbelopsis ramanniana AG]
MQLHVSVAAAALAIFSLVDAAQLSWTDAYTKAKKDVASLSLAQKVDVATGIGWMNGPCVGNTPPVDKIDFPGLCLQDSPLGVRFAFNVSGGIAGLNTASTFDKTLALQRGHDMGVEFREKGVNVQLGPDVNMARVPEAGRNWEGFGEDPYLTGVMGALTVEGIQAEGVIATAKHYILNEQEQQRTTSSSNIDDRSLHEVYVWPFARAVEAGVASIMCSYNKVNGVYACENDDTLNRILKEELGFKGFVQSDWQATMSGVPSALAGLDMTMPGDITFGSGNSYFGGNLTAAVRNGSVPLSRVNDMATRILASWYKLGQETHYPSVGVNFVNYTDAPIRNVQHNHKKTIRSIGAASVVLLKNNGNALPLKTPKSIGIIGSDGGPSPGSYSETACADHGCDAGTLAEGWGSGTAWFPYLVDPYKGIKARASRTTKFKTSFDDYDLEEAVAVAKAVETPIVFANADSGEGYITVGNNPGDRSNLTLWHGGDALIEAVADANPNTIVVLHTVGPVLMPWLSKVKAVINAGLPGQESGNSLADVLFGDVNPSGRLPYTNAKKASDYPAHAVDAAEIDYTEGLLIGHRWFDAKNIEPLFPFGFGLSYTKFGYNALKVKAAGSKVSITATIKNTGKVDGAEIPQLYIGFPKSAGEPPKVLRGFEKVFLKAGHSTKVTFDLDTAKELSIWNSDARKWEVVKGSFTVYVGASSRDIRLQGTFKL